MAVDLEEEVKKYRMIFDYHTHTIYSPGPFGRKHGKGTVEENVVAAEEAGLQGVAISDHGPGHIFYGLKREKINDIRFDVLTAQKHHPDLEIYMSCEANIMNTDNGLDLTQDEQDKFDFIIAGYHYGVHKGHMITNWLTAKKKRQGGGDNGLLDENGEPIDTNAKYERLREINTEMYIKAIMKNDIKILTHPGDKAPVDIEIVAKACAERGIWMEINTWHEHLTEREIGLAMKEDVKFVISSDAHSPERVGTFQPGLMRALAAGLDPERIVNIERI